MLETRGRVWRFGDNVNTDLMSPSSTWSMPWEEGRKQILPNRPEFAELVQPGDIIVAGQNWGCGSSRESAVGNLKRLGVSAVIAGSFSRIFFRNSVALGFPALLCADAVEQLIDGEEVGFSNNDFTVTRITDGQAFRSLPMPPDLVSIIRDGGLMARLKSLRQAGALQ